MTKKYRYICKHCKNKSDTCEVIVSGECGYKSTPKGMRGLRLIDVRHEIRYCIKCERELMELRKLHD